MYRKANQSDLTPENFKLPVAMQLSPDNRWVIMAKLIPWAELARSLAEVSSAKERAPRDEDHCRVRSGNSPRNLALLRRMALNALNQEKSLKRSLRQKMKRAAMNDDYMMTVLQSFCQ